MPPTFGDDVADLVLGGRCAGCGAPGRVLCGPCESSLPDRASLICSTSSGGGTRIDVGVPCIAAGDYVGVLRELVAAHKERRLVRLGPVLAGLLAVAVGELLVQDGGPGPVLLVPVPSRRAATRERGYQPTLAITRAAAGELRTGGLDVRSASLLRSRPGVVDQAGLGAVERHRNVAGSMAARPGELRAVAGGVPHHVVVCDDVVTTGSTAAEAVRALEAVGVATLGVAVIAATPRPVDRPANPGSAGLTGDSR